MVVAPKAATGTCLWSTDKFAVDLNVQRFAVVRLSGGLGGGGIPKLFLSFCLALSLVFL